MTFSKLLRPGRLRTILAAGTMALAATAWIAGPAAAGSGHGKSRGPGYSYSPSHNQAKAQRHNRNRPAYRRGYAPRHQKFRRHQRPRYRYYAPIQYVLPLDVIYRTLLHGQGYRTVQSARYKPAHYWNGYGPAYANGAFVAIAYRPNGKYVIHLDPYSGRVIQRRYAGRY